MFKVGDKVNCIKKSTVDSTFYGEIDSTYEVINEFTSSDGIEMIQILVDLNIRSVYADRFELITKSPFKRKLMF